MFSKRLICLLRGHKWDFQGWECIDYYGEQLKYTCCRCGKQIVTNKWL